jgi:multiple sugar transport system permease protein
MTHKRSLQPDHLWGYLFITPQLLGFGIFVALPLVNLIIFSLQDYNLLGGARTFVGLSNYAAAFGEDALFLKTFRNTLVFTAGLVPLNIFLALALSVMLKEQFFGNTVFRTIFFVPVVTSAVAWSLVWRSVLQGNDGALNQFLALVGIDGPNWLRSETWAMVSVIVVRVFQNVGMNMILFLTALANIPIEYHEAASIDGATRPQAFVRITLPLLAPTMLMVLMITIIGSLRVFDHILLLTAGGPNHSTMVLVYYVYYTAFRSFQPGYASVGALVLFVTSLVLTLFQWSARKRLASVEV